MNSEAEPGKKERGGGRCFYFTFNSYCSAPLLSDDILHLSQVKSVFACDGTW